ncbi:MAG: PD-(D/E)XK nuclease family protein [Planctomycetota bacterium]
MAKLVNELSWSRSRISMLRTCRRQYYYQYYLKWGGWGWDADPLSQKAYFFTKMTNLPMLCGNAVHEAIKHVLEDLRDHGELRLADPADHVRRDLLSKVWTDAEKELWRRSLKDHPPVFELYYPGMKPDRDTLKNLGRKAARCVENFLASELYRDLRADDPDRWLAVDEGPSFDDASKLKLDGRTLWALPDFARRTADGTCEIWDWKTGRANPNDEMQLLSYALNARDRWGFAPDRIRLFGFYLADDLVKEYPCDAERLAGMEDAIRADFEEMESLLADPARNEPQEDLDRYFPRLDEEETCRSCLFKELCGY